MRKVRSTDSACKDCGAPLFMHMNNYGEAVPRPSTYTPQECFEIFVSRCARKVSRGEDCGAPLDVVMNRYGRDTHQECFECGGVREKREHGPRIKKNKKE